jgi:hypothetical protein
MGGTHSTNTVLTFPLPEATCSGVYIEKTHSEYVDNA